MPGTAPTPFNYSPIVDEVITQQYLTGEWNNTLKIRQLWQKLNEAKAVTYDGSGKYIEWKVRLGEWGNFAERGDLVQRNFARKQHRATLTAGWSFLEPDPCPLLSERDIQFLNTPESITKFQNEFLTELGEDFMKAINSNLIARNISANTIAGVAPTAVTEYPFSGVLHFFQHGSGTAQNYVPTTNTTTGNVAATDREVLPNGTYYGLSTNPVTGVAGVDGQMAGSFAPVIINDTSTAFNGGATYSANCLDVLDYAQRRLTRSQETGKKPSLVLTSQTRHLVIQARIRASTSQQVILVDTSGRSPNLGLYNDGMIPWNGMWICYDQDLIGNYTLYLNPYEMKFRVFPQKYLAGAGAKVPGVGGKVPQPVNVTTGWDINVGAWKFVPTMTAQLTGNPFYQGISFGFA
jgi:hypothetical protein